MLSDLGRHNLGVDEDRLESPFFPIVYPIFNTNEANERDASRVGQSWTDIVTKLGGLESKASSDKFVSFFQETRPAARVHI